MSDERAYKGACFCGAVQLTVTGEPVGMGLLPLRFVQALVGRARQRLHAMEARGGTRYARRRQHRHLQQDARTAIANGASPAAGISSPSTAAWDSPM